MLTFLYSLLEHPLGYHLSQLVFAPGAKRLLTEQLRKTAQTLGFAGLVLDVGCGPASWLWKVGGHPVGLDLSFAYSSAFKNAGEIALTGSATALPFANSSFAGIWSIGLLHHLPKEAARQAIQEMLRVCRKGGYVAVLDAVLPTSPWQRPVAHLVRKLDRGRFMRKQTELVSLLPERTDWEINRFTYTLNGLEVLCCVWHKPMADDVN
ncbi:MAG TPA: hypothetical protein DEQ20_05970 [Desulfobulbaceae bacterium]|nr:MAG: hypothetical protein A2520_06945 [Deltaproteobacteria bacterium RIFOXYD12_FULL_53_23]HCC54456.1 hypothetical protein [Desulfobulbaceae bacterium]